MRSQVQTMMDEGLLKQVSDNKFELIIDQQEAKFQRSHMSELKRRHTMSAVEAQQLSQRLDELSDGDNDGGMD